MHGRRTALVKTQSCKPPPHAWAWRPPAGCSASGQAALRPSDRERDAHSRYPDTPRARKGSPVAGPRRSAQEPCSGGACGPAQDDGRQQEQGRARRVRSRDSWGACPFHPGAKKVAAAFGRAPCVAVASQLCAERRTVRGAVPSAAAAGAAAAAVRIPGAACGASGARPRMPVRGRSESRGRTRRLRAAGPAAGRRPPRREDPCQGQG